ncbi:MAG: gamma-glutamyl-gamma-aminobutyrate hydrolase family protein [Ginsengibacter sp.]
MKNIVIGITDCEKYLNYDRWIRDQPGVEIVKLNYRDNNLTDIETCDGIILSGGNDINPRLYNQPDYLVYCNPKDIDENRDEFEWKVMQFADEKQLPVLGICRGLQFVNVFFGGTLVPDIAAFGKFNHEKFEEKVDREHRVEVDINSLLYKLTRQEKGNINSAHHQSVDMPGYGLVVNALSPDGIIEGMERKNRDGQSYLMLVQWHPERMEDKESAFSKNIRESFLDAVRNNI